MRRFAAAVLAFMMSVMLGGSVARAGLEWRQGEVAVEGPSLTDPALNEGIEIYSYGGSIIVKTPKDVEVKVFTILGQVVSQARLKAGTSVLEINSRGIYIVKIGNMTQKVAL